MQISGRSSLPELCREAHPETALLQFVCCALRSTEQSALERRKGRKGAEKRGGRGVASKGGKTERRMREYRSGLKKTKTFRSIYIFSRAGLATQMALCPFLCCCSMCRQLSNKTCDTDRLLAPTFKTKKPSKESSSESCRECSPRIARSFSH